MTSTLPDQADRLIPCELEKFCALVGPFDLASVFIAKGSSCEVWKLTAGGQAFALRVFSGRRNGCSPETEAAIRQSLWSEGGAVVPCHASSGNVADITIGADWSLDAFVEGFTYQRGQLPASVCVAVGKTLAGLHRLPTRCFGPPAVAANGTFQGREVSPIAGVNARFEQALPCGDVAIAQNPLIAAAPEMKAAVGLAVRKIFDLLDGGANGICHTDLHERQLICVDGRLAALIDFGDAMIGDIRWDLASFFYFHGEDALDHLLEGYYGGEPGERDVIAKQARLFSFAIALHHASRSRIPGKEHRLAVALRHVRRLMTDNAGQET